MYLAVHHVCFFFFNDTATTEIYTLSLHDALPIYQGDAVFGHPGVRDPNRRWDALIDRKSTRLNSSHANISYAVFCSKKKNSTSKTSMSIKKKKNKRHEQNNASNP